MPYEIWTDPRFQRELDELAERDRNDVIEDVNGLIDHPLEHPQLVRVKGTAYPGSFRLRAGRFRVMGLVLDGPELILLTMVFLKKRELDYDQAIKRNEGRMRLQGPPLDEYVKSARRRR